MALCVTAPWLAMASGLPAPDPSKRLDQFVHDHWTTEDGLPSVEIQALLRSQDGYLWLATRNGLARFDGVRFEIFDQSSHPELPVASFGALVEDAAGVLWIGSLGGGILRYEEGRFEAFVADSPARGQVRSLLFDREGELWGGTLDGLVRLREGRLEPYFLTELEGLEIGQLFEDHRGALWIATRNQGVFVLWQGRCHRVADEQGAIIDPGEGAGTAWTIDAANTVSNRVGSSDGAGEDRVIFLGHSMGRSEGEVRTLVRDAADSLWVGTSSHLERHVDGRFESRLFAAREEGRILRHYSITSLLADRDGSLWVGTYGDGLHRFGNAPITPFLVLEGSSAHSTSAVLENSKAELLAISEAGSLVRVNGHRLETLWSAEDVPFDQVFALAEDQRGRLVVGTSEGLFRFEEDRFRHWTVAEGLPHPEVRVVMAEPDSADGLLVGTYGGGVVRFRDDTFEPLATEDRLSDLRVRSLLWARDGALWIATEAGLNRYYRGRIEIFTTLHGLGSNAIRPLYEDADGVLWIGTAGGGLARYRDGIFTAYTKRQGLPQNDVWALVEDDAERLWWSTDQGIVRVPKAAFDAYDLGQIETLPARSYDLRDGLKHVEGNGHGRPATWKTSDGMLWMISTVGFNRIDPSYPDPAAPSVSIESLLAGDRATDFRATPVLPYERRNLRIRYSAPSFEDPHAVRFRYRLEGYENEWQYAEGRREAFYTNVPEGTHTFGVIAEDAQGRWTAEEARFDLRVLPPPWRTGWAYGLYLLSAVLLVFGAFGAHQRKLERQRELQREEAEKDRQLIRRLREVDRLKDEFLANTSHELRTPLHGMMGLAESLINGARGDLSEGVVADLSSIAASGRRLSHLVGDILDFSELRHHSLVLRCQPVDLHSIVDVVLTLSRPLIGDKDLELSSSIPFDSEPAEADENRLQQILHNLVGNAIKFTESGTIEVSAEKVASSDPAVEGAKGDRWWIRVSDTGVGIAPAEQERIFGAFEQLDSDLDRQFGGTGLGLAITSELVALHGGRLRVESRVGKGSVFSFDLPVAEKAAVASGSGEIGASVGDDSLEVPMFTDTGKWPTVVAPAEPTAECADPNARILVIDDEPINLAIIANFLGHEGYGLVTAQSGEEALRLFESEEFDLVLLDVMMPRMSGYEVCRALRADHPLDELPIIFLSAMGQSTDRVAGLEQGANDFLSKPINQAELLSRVATHLKLLAAHRARAAELSGLRDLLPICSHCKKIRDDQGYWSQLEVYIAEHAGTRLSHGICPDCESDLMTELERNPGY